MKISEFKILENYTLSKEEEEIDRKIEKYSKIL